MPADVTLDLPTLDVGSPLAADLLAWWPMRPSGGSTIPDLGPSGRHDLVIHGSKRFTETQYGPAYSNWSGSSAEADAGDYAGITGLAGSLFPLTLWAWAILPTRLSWNDLLYVHPSSGFKFGIARHSSSDTAFASLNGGSSGPHTTALFTGNTWHLVCGVFVSNTERHVYIDGGNVGSSTDNWSASGSLEAIYLGLAAPGFAAFHSLNGHIADAGIHARAFTAAEVAEQYRLGPLALALSADDDPTVVLFGAAESESSSSESSSSSAEATTTVGRSLLLASDTRATVGSALSATSGVRGLAGRSLTATAAIRAGVGASAELLARTHAAVGRSAPLSSGLRETVGSAAALQSQTRDAVGASAVLASGVRVAVGASLTLAADVRAAVSASAVLTANVLSSSPVVGRALDLRSSVLAAVGRSGAIAADTRATAGRSQSVSADTRDLASASVALQSRVSSVVGASLTLTAGVGSLQPEEPTVTITSDPADVLLRVRAAIVAAAVYSETQAAVSLEREPHPARSKAGEFCHVAPGPFRPRGWADGGGRYDQVVDGTVVVRCYARRTLDPINADTIAVAGSATGYAGVLRRAFTVIDAIDNRFVVDGDGNHLTAEPLRLLDQGEPIRYRRGREWIWCEVRFEATILLNLTIAEGD